MSTSQGSRTAPSAPLPIDEIVTQFPDEADPPALQEEIIEAFLR
jgi:hypothetical protein